MLHNYCHWLPFAVPENEFSLSVEKYIQFWDVISWDTIFIQFFSFWGHLGVSVFVFLSGYGLVKKYDDTNINWKSFIIKHWFSVNLGENSSPILCHYRVLLP